MKTILSVTGFHLVLIANPSDLSIEESLSLDLLQRPDNWRNWHVITDVICILAH